MKSRSLKSNSRSVNQLRDDFPQAAQWRIAADEGNDAGHLQLFQAFQNCRNSERRIFELCESRR
jgi:hypothetical protein